MIEVKSSDLTARIGKPTIYDDAFQAIVDHYLKAGRLTVTVYQIDKAGGWADKQNRQARELVLQQLAGGAGGHAQSDLHRLGQKRRADGCIGRPDESERSAKHREPA